MAKRKPLTLGEATRHAWVTHYQYCKGAREHSRILAELDRRLGARTPLADVRSAALRAFIQTLREAGNTGATINRKVACLQKVWRIALRDELLDAAMPQFPKQREGEHRIRWLSRAEESSLFKHLDADTLDLCTVLVDTGLRLGEALRLDKDSLTGDMVTVWESKGGRARSVPLTRRAAQVLRERALAAAFGPLFKRSKSYYERHFGSARGAAGLGADVVVHTLRHTTASRLVQAGVPLYEVKEVLGHSSITTTERYAHLSPERLKGAMSKLEVNDA